jgi:hypothetical protein
VTYLDEVATDIRNAVPPDALPDGDTRSLFLSYAVLLLAKGEAVTQEDVHNAWVAWAASMGGDREAMVPFSELSLVIQAEDLPFVIAIRAVAQSRRDAESS